jgi:hypothetical protein
MATAARTDGAEMINAPENTEAVVVRFFGQ